jgi:hypothetical protein
VKRQTVCYLVVAVPLVDLLVFLLGSDHWTATRHYHSYAPSATLLLVIVVDEMILSVRKPGLPALRRRRVGLRSGKSIGLVLAYFSGAGISSLFWLSDIRWTVSGVAFLALTTLYGLAAATLGRGIFWDSRGSGRALLVVGALMAVLAAVVPLFRLEGADWEVRGWHPAYFLVGSAVLVAVAGAVALRQARRLGGAPDFWIVPKAAS